MKILLIKVSQPEYIGDVLWGQKSRTKITMIKKNRKGRTREKKKTHLPKTKGIKKVIITTDKGIDITSVKIIHKSTIGF